LKNEILNSTNDQPNFNEFLQKIPGKGKGKEMSKFENKTEKEGA
jgi:hypothetical protein